MELIEVEPNILKKVSKVQGLIKQFSLEAGISKLDEAKLWQAGKLPASKAQEIAESGGITTETTSETKGISPEKEKGDTQERRGQEESETMEGEEGEVTIG